MAVAIPIVSFILRLKDLWNLSDYTGCLGLGMGSSFLYGMIFLASNNPVKICFLPISMVSTTLVVPLKHSILTFLFKHY